MSPASVGVRRPAIAHRAPRAGASEANGHAVPRPAPPASGPWQCPRAAPAARSVAGPEPALITAVADRHGRTQLDAAARRASATHASVMDGCAIVLRVLNDRDQRHRRFRPAARGQIVTVFRRASSVARWPSQRRGCSFHPPKIHARVRPPSVCRPRGDRRRKAAAAYANRSGMGEQVACATAAFASIAARSPVAIRTRACAESAITRARPRSWIGEPPPCGPVSEPTASSSSRARCPAANTSPVASATRTAIDAT